MTVERNNDNDVPEDKKAAMMAFRLSGMAFIAVGVSCFIFQEQAMDLLSMDNFTLKLFGGMIACIGLIEVLFIKKIFSIMDK